MKRQVNNHPIGKLPMGVRFVYNEQKLIEIPYTKANIHNQIFSFAQNS